MDNLSPIDLWNKCMDILQDEVNLQQFNTWLSPLKVMADEESICLLAPNRFVLEWVKEKFMPRIEEVIDQISSGVPPMIALGVTSRKPSFSRKYQKVDFADQNNKTKRHYEAEHRSETVVGLQRNYNDASVVNLLQKAEKNKKTITKEKSAQETQKLKKDAKPDIKDKVLFNGADYKKALGSLKHKNSSFLSRKIKKAAGISFDAHSLSKKSYAKKRETQNKAIKTGNKSTLEKEANKRTWRSKNEELSPDSLDPRYADTLKKEKTNESEHNKKKHGTLNPLFTFDSFVEGKSNQIALSAARQTVANPGETYNPFFIYGGVGLGKTHIMQAIGNSLVQKKNITNVVYLHSERFVSDMVKALQLNIINDFKKYYRSVEALLVDDIQFFLGKGRTQEEFFHTFNALLEGGQQIILTCDRYPKELNGLDERLKSRFGWGLTVAVEPPELETRIAILIKKAEQMNVGLSYDSAAFIAQRLKTNVRELEGALKRVVASSHFMGVPITVDLIREALKDLLALQEKMISADNIQKVVTEYFNIKRVDFLSKSRKRCIARPRQVSMMLSKKLTNNSLSDIGKLHGGRDHTTVMHACQQVQELIELNSEFKRDYDHILKLLTT